MSTANMIVSSDAKLVGFIDTDFTIAPKELDIASLYTEIESAEHYKAFTEGYNIYNKKEGFEEFDENILMIFGFCLVFTFVSFRILENRMDDEMKKEIAFMQ